MPTSCLEMLKVKDQTSKYNMKEQVKPGFTDYQPHPSILWPEVK